MAQLVLFNNNDGPGPKEFTVIDDEDFSKEELEEEYGAKVVEQIDLGSIDLGSFPTNRSLVSE